MSDPNRETGRNLPQLVRPSRTPPARRMPVGFEDWQAEERPGGGPTLEHYLRTILQRRWMVLSVAVTVVVLAGLQVYTTTPLYRATATLQIDETRQNILPYEEVDPSGAGGYYFQDYLATQVERLQSRSLRERVAARLHESGNPDLSVEVRQGILLELLSGAKRLARRPFAGFNRAPAGKPSTGASAGLPGSLEVEIVSNTSLVGVSFTSPVPELSALVANTLVAEFIDQSLEGRYEATTHAADFLAHQLEELKSKVETSEEDLLRYAQQNSIVNLNERETIGRKRLADLNDELTRAEAELIDRRSRAQSVAGATLEGFPDSLKSEALRTLEGRLAERELAMAGLSTRFGSEWPEVKKLRDEIEELRQQAADEIERIGTAARREYEHARNHHAQLTAAVDGQTLMVDDLNQSTIQYNILQRDSQSNEQLYQGILQRLKEAGVSASLKSSNIHVADQAQPPGTPSAPRKGQALGLAALLGLALGIVAAVVIEQLDNSVKTTEDVTEVLRLPALGLVPSLGERAGRRFFRRQTERAGAPSVAFEPGRTERGQAIEAYRSLRTALLLSHLGQPPQVMLVSSALPGEGKSTTAVNIAIAFAQTGARTLLLELDLRQPSLAGAFDGPNGFGISTYLTGNSDLSSQIRETRFENLLFLPAGPQPPNPAELIGSHRMATALQLLREYFTHIVIDTPPCLGISDALLISAQVDGVILVVRGGHTPRKLLTNAADGFHRVGATLLGVVVNDVDLEQPRYGSYYGSHKYLGRRYLRYYTGEGGESKRTA